MTIEVGMTFETTRSGLIEVIAYKGSRNVDVRFLDSGNKKSVTAQNIRTGMVLDKEAIKKANKGKLVSKKVKYAMVLRNGETYFGKTYNDLSAASGIAVDTIKSVASFRFVSRTVANISTI
ncbi:MAG: hypothetical protein ACRCZ2_08730 [Fusobacteriaceae bacterium]